ncbi:hypothetical protein [Streptomyces sp. NPDC005568]|uniref:hypothetical protein n=1 Tax=Streptomyces sp. NPDC005568 TaxID=3156887 RepID=UPI0033ADE0B1
MYAVRGDEARTGPRPSFEARARRTWRAGPACFGPTKHLPQAGVNYDNSVHLTVNGSTKIAPAPSIGRD